ncbi:uncharacterized protein F4812DRAFT_64966 [Daldinia caldariorum]|uniref:uncharacterized protein n=1 Tax=Daldinia caldariorum TaxID=326644 RepID=UPI00200880A6|nr:uncharacterized protein F4812DRAFT_64966 [Daldinia caldariorum]KAI1466758.1 hypothetical protein F4812DRAFT_64966 [Daldinia caldariorum]
MEVLVLLASGSLFYFSFFLFLFSPFEAINCQTSGYAVNSGNLVIIICCLSHGMHFYLAAHYWFAVM